MNYAKISRKSWLFWQWMEQKLFFQYIIIRQNIDKKNFNPQLRNLANFIMSHNTRIYTILGNYLDRKAFYINLFQQVWFRNFRFAKKSILNQQIRVVQFKFAWRFFRWRFLTQSRLRSKSALIDFLSLSPVRILFYDHYLPGIFLRLQLCRVMWYFYSP